MDMPVNVPVDNPNADTEWNDILRSHGIIPPKPPSPTAEIENALTQARELAHASRLENKTLDELDDLEDEELDTQFLDSYRQRRMQELNTLAKTSIFGSVYHLQKPDYAREVSEASASNTVMVLLIGPGDESRLMQELWRRLADRFGDVKFVQMEAIMCIENYPEKNTPTVLCYKDGDIVKQVVTLKELNGLNTEIQDWESVLVKIGTVDKGDVRLLTKNQDEEDDFRQSRDGASGGSLRFGSKRATQDDDEDSDLD